MGELEMRGMESDARNAALLRFRGMIFAVADEGVADGGKLHADLVLQSGNEGNAHQRSAAEAGFDRIA